MSSLSAELSAATINATLTAAQTMTATLSASHAVVNDYTISVSDITGGYRLTITKGSQTQTIDIMNGTAVTRTNIVAVLGSDSPNLSDNNYTTAEKTKLNGIEAGAEVNVQSDWNQTDSNADDYIKNKPSIPSALSDLTDDSSHRTVSDAEKTKLNGIEVGADVTDTANVTAAGAEMTSNKVTSIGSANTDAQYPSAKAVYDASQACMANFAAAYSASGTYAVNDYCTYDGHFYVCSTAITTAEAWTAAHWTLTTTAAELKNIFANYVQTAKDIQKALDTGVGAQIPLGTQITSSHATYGTITWDVVHATNDYVELLTHNCVDKLQFNSAEALYYAENALPAGNYSFVAYGNTTYYLTLTMSIPAGGQLCVTTSKFYTYDSRTNTVHIETGSLTTTAIEGAASLGTAGTGNINHMDRALYGSNDYSESALDQFATSNAGAGSAWTPKTKFSRPPSWAASKAGFLNGLDAKFLRYIADTTVKCSSNNVYAAPDSGHQKSTAYTLTRKFYLASEMEIFGSYGGVQDGSAVYGLYDGATAADRIKRYNGSSCGWWLRSPRWTHASTERLVYNGTANQIASVSDYGVVLACRIVKTV